MKTRRGDTFRRHGDEPPSPGVSASFLGERSIITLLTDFGTADYFVGAVKGVILSSNPETRIVDLTHEIPPHDIEAAAFTLLAANSSFPAGTVHLAVVDPGVGSSRRPIVIEVHDQFFVGPDNGVFSYVCDHVTASPAKIFHVTNEKYFRKRSSETFHGRDIFAPVAAALANGVKPKELGTPITDMVRLPLLTPTTTRGGDIKGRIIHIDRFGNCITNITPVELTADLIAAGAKLRINGKTVKSFRKFFAEESGSRDKLFGMWGSAGFLEIAAANESAAKILKAKRGDAVVVESTAGASPPS